MKTKSVKRTEAEERQIRSTSLTTSQKIDRLNKGCYRALKERKRLGLPEVPSDCVK
jgi:hypothetical protein